MAETKQKCAAILQEKPVRRRIGFWTFLSQVWRFTGVPMWAAQGMTSILFFLAAAGQEDLISWLPLLGPLLVAACLPVLFAGQRYDMDELEASTCVSRTELALAKLILAAAADLVILTSALVLGRAQTGKALLALFFLSVGSFFVLCGDHFNSAAALPAEQWNTLYCDMFHHSCGAADGTPYSTAAV